MEFDECVIIVNLQERGPRYLEKLYDKCSKISNNTSGEQKEAIDMVNRYAKNYITDEEIFEDGQHTFIDYMKTTNTNIWSTLCDSNLLDKQTLLELINTFGVNTFKMTLDEKITFYSNMLRSTNVSHELFNTESWELYNASNLEHNTFLGIMLIDLKIDNPEQYNTDADKICDFIDTILYQDPEKISNREDCLFKWFADISNLNMGNINVGHVNPVIEGDVNVSSDEFLISSTFILLRMWDRCLKKMTSVECDAFFVDTSYTKDKQCPIKGYTKKTDNDKTYSYLNKLFFLILNSMRICYTPVLRRSVTWPNAIEDLNKTKNMLEIQGSMFYQSQLMRLYKQIKDIKDRYTLDDKLSHNVYICKNIDNFYYNFIDIINKGCIDDRSTFNLDDSLYDLAYYQRYISKDLNMKYTYKQSFIDLYLLVVGSNQITSNPDIKNSFVMIVNKLMLSEEITKSIKQDQMKKIISSILQVIEYYDSYKENRVDYFFRKITALQIIQSILKHYCIGNNKKTGIELVEEVLKHNLNSTKNLIGTIYNECYWLGEKIDDKISNIVNCGWDVDKGYEDSIDLHKITTNHQTLLSIIGMLIANLPEFRKVTSCPEILTTFVTVLNTSFTRLATEFKFSFHYLTTEDMIEEGLPNINMTQYFMNIMSPFMYLENTYNFLDFVVNDSINFDITNFREAITYLKSNNLQTNIIDPIEKLVDNMKKKIEDNYLLEEEELVLDYPEEFLDPLTYIKIVVPILLPSNGGEDIFMEEYVIKKHLLLDKINPFTRTYLTLDQLEEYNKQSKILLKIEEFKTKMLEWEFMQK
jgi:hypothetical protein